MSAIAAFFLGLLMHIPGGAAVHSALTPESPTPPLPTDTSGEPLRIPIFIYHAVTNEERSTKDQEVFTTKPALLEEQLEYLNDNGYTTVTMKQVADMLRRGTTSPITKPVALTFDDGWVTQYEHAYPLLKKYGVTATFYIFPNPVSKDERFMTWEQLEEIRDSKMEIASHSFSHPALSKLTPEELHQEFAKSKQVLEEKLGVTVTNLAMPFGFSSPLVTEELKRNGYETGRTVEKGATHALDSTYELTGYLVHADMHDFVWALEHAK